MKNLHMRTPWIQELAMCEFIRSYRIREGEAEQNKNTHEFCSRTTSRKGF